MRKVPWLAVAGVLLAALAWTGSAMAYCLTTTCNPATEFCQRDGSGCVTSGEPLFWASGCVTFATQSEGSPLRGIRFEQTNQIASRAFRTWVSARCSERDEHPSLGAVALGWAECDVPEYNNEPPLPNANVIMFRDETWPYGGVDATIALTTITFDVGTGQILDSDIELNSFGVVLTTSETAVQSDLQSILTHEVGHALGLAHTRVEGATMNADYDRTDLAFRTLHRDDELAICSNYPPGRDLESCRGAQPRYGFSRYCGEPYEPAGCAITKSSPVRAGFASSPPWPYFTLLAAWLLLGRRKKMYRST